MVFVLRVKKYFSHFSYSPIPSKGGQARELEIAPL